MSCAAGRTVGRPQGPALGAQRVAGRRGVGCSSCRSARLRVLAVAAGPARLAVHVGETTVAFPLPQEEGQRISAAISATFQTFADMQAAERPKRWASMEYRYKGEAAGQVEQLEVLCNPNAHPSAISATVFITVCTREGVSVSTEGKLTSLKADVDAFLEAGGSAAGGGA